MFLVFVVCFFFFKQKTAYEMRISDWSSDVCSSDVCSSDLTGYAYGPAAQMLQLLLDPRKMLGLADRTCTNDHVRLAGQDGAGQLGNVLAFILVVCIRVDNHVCAQLQACLQADHERGSQAAVDGVPDDMIEDRKSGVW